MDGNLVNSLIRFFESWTLAQTWLTLTIDEASVSVSYSMYFNVGYKSCKVAKTFLGPAIRVYKHPFEGSTYPDQYLFYIV